MSSPPDAVEPQPPGPGGEAALRGAGVGRGIIYLTLSRGTFLATRLVYFFLLPRLLAGPAEYGNFVVAIGIAVAASTVFINGTQQAVSKLSAEEPALADAVRTTALRSRLWICALVILAFLAGAELLASLFNDAALAPLFRVGGIIVAANGFFAVLLGSANGTGRFGKQAVADIFMSFAKLSLVLGAAAGAGTALVAISGFAAAQVLGVVIAIVLIGVRPWQGHYPFKRLWSYESALLVFSLVMSIAVQSDLFLLKALLPAAESAEEAGLYAAAQIFAQVPAALTMSVNLVILPVVAAALARKADQEAQESIRNLLGLALFAVLWAGLLISLNAPTLIGLVYPAEYLPAAPALRVLVFGGACFTLLSICTSIVTAAGMPRVSVALAGVYLVATWALGFVLIPRLGMLGSAWTHVGGGLIALAAALVVVRRVTGAGLPLKRAGRLAGATAATLFLIGAAFEGAAHPSGPVSIGNELLFLLFSATVQSLFFILFGGVGRDELMYLRNGWRRLRGRR